MFLSMQKLVAKPDQLIKRRGKLGLIKVNADIGDVVSWIGEKLHNDVKVRPMNTFTLIILVDALCFYGT